MSWLWLSLAIVVEACATLCVRASDGYRKRWWLVPIVAGYLASFVFLSLALRAGMPVGVAYGVWTAIGIALVALLARALWRDPLTWRMIAGIVVIMAGVVLIELG
ncbi:DMT family transporter [Gordonia sp. VNK21]|uniref:DMT family transporter n=1 Tax=Gordonia sp. VNK21 TaxID=3382483 RepID=UPI0038D4B320